MQQQETFTTREQFDRYWNENYVNKAPAHIVEMDRKKLEEETKKLEELLK